MANKRQDLERELRQRQLLQVIGLSRYARWGLACGLMLFIVGYALDVMAVKGMAATTTALSLVLGDPTKVQLILIVLALVGSFIAPGWGHVTFGLAFAGMILHGFYTKGIDY